MRWLGIFALAALPVCISVPVAAATLTIGKATIQKLLVERVFNNNGRWYLQDGICYAYLESPRTWLAEGRVFIEAHLASQLGVEMSGQCVGSSFASKVVLSGRLVGAATTLTLAEVRFDRVADETTGGASDLLQSIAPTLPPIDVLQTIRDRLADADEIPIAVDTLQINNVTTSDTAVAVRFDFALSAP
jgi:hypothetical protein